MTTSGSSAHGAFAEQRGAITLTNTSITTNGASAYDLFATSGGTISQTGGTITRTFAGSSTSNDYAIDASGASSTITLNSLTASTSGQHMVTVNADTQGAVTLNNVTCLPPGARPPSSPATFWPPMAVPLS